MSYTTFYPTLAYADPRAAMDFLSAAFGFVEEVKYVDPADQIQHAEMSFGSGRVMLGPKRTGSPFPQDPISVYVAVDDPDGHFAAAVAAGAEIVGQPRDTEYGSRDYSARDPEGNVWVFGTYRP